MTSTLLDILMLTSLNISAPDRSCDLLSKTNFKLDTWNTGGWKGYIERYSKSGATDHRKHAAFLNMWLEKYIFCSKSVSPTSNTLKMAETLASGNHIPLGKASPRISVSSSPSSVGPAQSRSANRQSWRALVVLSAVVEHIHAQDHGSELEADVLPIRELCGRATDSDPPMHFLW